MNKKSFNFLKIVCAFNPSTRQIRSAYSRLWSLRFLVATLPVATLPVATLPVATLLRVYYKNPTCNPTPIHILQFVSSCILQLSQISMLDEHKGL